MVIVAKTRWLGVALGLALAFSVSGCSFMFVSAPPAEHEEHTVVRCTTSKLAPALDVVGVGLQAVRVGLAAGSSDSDYSGAPISREADIGLGVAIGALVLGSAVYGFSTTASCEREIAEANLRKQQELAAPPGSVQGAAQPAAPAIIPAPISPVRSQVSACTYDAQCPATALCVAGRCSSP